MIPDEERPQHGEWTIRAPGRNALVLKKDRPRIAPSCDCGGVSFELSLSLDARPIPKDGKLTATARYSSVVEQPPRSRWRDSAAREVRHWLADAKPQWWIAGGGALDLHLRSRHGHIQT